VEKRESGPVLLTLLSNSEGSNPAAATYLLCFESYSILLTYSLNSFFTRVGINVESTCHCGPNTCEIEVGKTGKYGFITFTGRFWDKTEVECSIGEIIPTVGPAH
jgi:hypothetical protein